MVKTGQLIILLYIQEGNIYHTLLHARHHY